MSRSGYSDDYEGNPDLYRQAVENSIRGRRGQAFLRELLTALDELPEKKLVHGAFFEDGAVCALGAVAKKRSIDLRPLQDYEDEEIAPIAGRRLGIATTLAAEIMYMNDDAVWENETEENRFERIRRWTASNIRD